MTPIGGIVWLLLAVTFAMWTWTAFGVLRGLARVAADRRRAGDRPTMGPSGTIGVFGDFVRGRLDPEGRLRLIILTLCLLGLSLSAPALL